MDAIPKIYVAIWCYWHDELMSVILKMHNLNLLTHWGRDKMAAILQMTGSHVCSWNEQRQSGRHIADDAFKFTSVYFYLGWKSFRIFPIYYMSGLVYIMIGGDQPTNHYLNQQVTNICNISRTVIFCISGALRLMLSVWIWIPQTLITWSRLHSNDNHSPHGPYSQTSEIHSRDNINNLIIGLCQRIWMVMLGGHVNKGNICIGRTVSLYWTCPNNQTFGIKFKVFVFH